MSNTQVVLEDLKAMADNFTKEGKNYGDLAKKVSPEPVDSGDASLNAVMASVLEVLSVLHNHLAGSIEEHGDQLTHAHDSYARQDIDNRKLFDDVMKGME